VLNPAEPPVIVFGDHTRCVKFVTERFVQGADGVKVLKPRPHVVPRYAELMLRAINIPAKGYSRHMKFLRASYFPICGVAEQEEIVRRVDRAFSEIDRLTTDAAAAHRLLDRLDLAALKKAFRGNLVPQDPADEPASVLLDRIRAGRAATPKAKRRYSSRTSAVRKSDMPKSRLDNDVKHRPFLASILKASSTALSADSLFEAADLPITDFYKQLTWEIDNGFVKERDRMLEAA
jgi:type I restriction enzyme S subunit